MIIVDAHVHIYDCFGIQAFLDSTLGNFKLEALRFGQANSFTAVLLLAETPKEDWFHRLANYADDEGSPRTKAIGSWTFYRTDEKCSLYAQNGSEQGVFLIAGRQIVSAEDLEVLALLTHERFPDGTPVLELIKGVKETGGIPVIPWGFGKWIGQRGKILKTILKLGEFQELFLGDTGNRPSFLPRPSHFKIAEEGGVRKLPGSDPLPLASECGRAGSFGFSVDGSLSFANPARDLKQIFMNATPQFRTYGQPENFYRFIRNQFLLRLNSP